MTADADEPERSLRLVVGVGASAGGLEAFRQLLAALPADSGMAFLLVQHLAPRHESLLAELLTPCTSMPVLEADKALELRPNVVYVIHPDTALGVRGGKLELSTPTLHRGVRLPVDHLFRSLAHDYGGRAAGVVLSGAGSDGSSGLREIKAAGGLTIAQDPRSSSQTGMPQSAIDTGAVDLVLQIDEIPAALERFANLPPEARTEPVGVDDDELPRRLSSLTEQELGRLAAVLQAQMSFDLRVYKPGTIERRVIRRMTLAGHENANDYFEHLRRDPSEQQLLIRDLLINVTDFFREPRAFATLRELVIDPMVSSATSGTVLRVWVPGCATGEEAYSLGMEFLDAIDASNKRLSVQIFATDIDAEALAFGRAAIYPASIVDHVPKARLETYFRPLEGKGFQVRPPLRDLVSFAVHDLTRDPPFSRMNLVSCRNVLIYLTTETQRHVLSVLHFALAHDGHLFLSTSESVGSQRGLFSTVSKSQRIYKKLGVSRPIALTKGSARHHAERDAIAAPAPMASPPPHRRLAAGEVARRAVMDAWVPPTIVLAEDGSVLFMHGELGPFLRFPQGENPRLDLISLLRPELATRTRGALYKCRQSREPVVSLFTPDDKSLPPIRITAKPAAVIGSEAVMLTFEHAGERTPEGGLSTRTELPTSEVIVEELERELNATREDLHNAVEELETSNEELRSSNEESMSMNEELQSANEELEATTEELRSLNEELSTVNAQLREKVEQLELAHDDLDNFFSSTKIATLFLDERLCIKRFTPAAHELLGVDHADSGRIITDMARELLQNDLVLDAQDVLEHFSSRTRELRTSDGRWFVRHVLPYRTESRRIEGVVVTFNDVTDLRSANMKLAAKSRRLELAWEAARGGVYEHRIPLDETTYHSDQWARILGYRRDELPPFDRLFPWLHEQVHPDDRDRVDRAYRDFVDGRTERYRVELRLRHRAGNWIWVRGVSKALERNSDGSVGHILGMMIDITDLKTVEEALRESECRFREMADGLPLMVWVHDESGRQEYVNATFCEFYGVDHDEVLGARWQRLLHPDDAERYTREIYDGAREQRAIRAEARFRRADGEWRWVESWARPRWTQSGEFRGLVGTSADITERRRIEDTLRDSEERFRTLADNIAQQAWMAHGDGWIFWYNERWYDYTGTTPEDVTGWGWRIVHHPDHVERVVEKIRRCFQEGEIWEDTFPLRSASGEYRWFLSRAVPVRDEHGTVVRWLGTNTDVTELRRYEQKLLEADRQKDEFLAMLGHELRNPLAAIRSAVEWLKTDARDPTTKEKARAIMDRQSTHMAKLLDGLLDVSRIIQGKIRIERELVDLATICLEVVDDLQRRLPPQGPELHADLPGKPIWVDGDRVRLVQVLENLLTNAIKYTPAGGTVQLELRQDEDMALLEIRDTGVGIEPEMLPHVFEIFRQSERSVDRNHGGLGLGLALVKSLIELHDGSVELRSEGKDRGTQVLVQIPLSSEPRSCLERLLTSPGNQLHILMIEDNEDFAEMMRVMLEHAGHEVTLAARGRQGVELAKEQRPDAIMCDLGLPDGMNGFEVARELRADARTRKIPLIGVSGFGRPEYQAHSTEAGFDALLAKPIDIDALQDVLARLSESRGDHLPS